MKKNIFSTFKYETVVLVKVILLYLFSSEYSTLLFEPFVTNFINNGFQNPYNFYLEGNLNLDAFPYHSLMLFILVPFSAIASLVDSDAIFKLPLLFADLSILYFLTKLSPLKI